jgi:hypothetical protein
MTSVIGTLTTGFDEITKVKFPYLHGATDLHAPRQIWQSSEARLHWKVFNRTYDHSAQETEI